MNYQKLNNITGWVVWAIASFVFLSTMEQTTSLWDCGEYITTANKLEVGHPPGAPFFMMLGRLFSAFASPENAAMMVNAMSALSSSFSVLFLFWSITMLGRKLARKSGEIDKNASIAILGSGAVGALAYTFTDSFWFSAVEGEVYAMSSFFTAIVFWAILKWDVEDDKHQAASENETLSTHPNRWILFIAYMIGLSIGVHLLNLLAIPAIVFVVYFKKYKFSWGSFILAGILSLVILVGIQNFIIPKTVSIADWVERLFTNDFGLPFNSGALFFITLLTTLIIGGLIWTAKNGKSNWNTAILSFALVLIGYSSFVMILVRSNANPPLDENNPETLAQLQSYLGREQYGSWPIGFGQYWNSPAFSDCDADHLGDDKVKYMKVFSLKTKSISEEVEAKDTNFIKNSLLPLNLHPRFIKNPSTKKLRSSIWEKNISFMNEWELNAFKADCDSINNILTASDLPAIISFEKDIQKQYLNTLKGKKGDKKYMPEYCTIFPRMYRQGEGDKYKVWSDYRGDKNKPLPALAQLNNMLPNNYQYRDQQYQALRAIADNTQYPKEQRDYVRDISTNLYQDGLYIPSFGENLSYMFSYQLNWMYWRYFMWNFSGRQNDIQGYGLTGGGGKILEGNWLSGVNFIDNQRLGDQTNVSKDITLNKGYNRYFMLPLLLGLIGLIFHMIKHPKGAFVVFMLYLLTGIAIVIYLNQKPAEPRERDYAYAASFYAFAIWIGLSIWALYDFAKNAKIQDFKKVLLYAIGGSFGILLVQFLIGNGMTLGLSLAYMAVVTSAVLGFLYFIGGKLKGSPALAFIPVLIGLFVVGLLGYQNWDDHDRSNRSTARDFAANYLNSCDYNAILFTNGDNDTFPLWYIQEVEGVRTDVRVANMSLLSTDWHINQMKKRAYESDPLPIKMRESVYREGKRDYVLINQNEQKKYKNIGLKRRMEKVLNDFKKRANKGTFNNDELKSLLKMAYWLKDIADSLESNRSIVDNKSLSEGTIALINGSNNNPIYENKANGFIRLAGPEKITQQLPQLISSIEKTYSNWPQRWYSAQEAIAFISNDRNKKFQSFSCNNESFIDFSNIYINVNTDNAIKSGIIDSADVKNPKYRQTIQWRLKGSMLYKADIAVLSLLANYEWDRPIYFASVVGMQANKNLQKQMYCEGLAYKLTPIEYGGTGGTNTEKMLALLNNDYDLVKRNGDSVKVGFDWGNMKGEGVLVDYYTMRMVQNLRLQMMKLSDQLINENRYDDALNVLNITFEEMPVEKEQVPADDICYYLCANYFEAGDTTKGLEIGHTLVSLQLDRLNFFSDLDNDKFLPYVWPELGRALFNVEMLREASLTNLDRTKMFEPNSATNNASFLAKGVLANTNYDEICLKLRNVYRNNPQKKKFFENQQKFPSYYTQLWKSGI